MASAYDLSALNPAVFEHLVGALALRVLGAGVSSFGPGPDGGRDGLFVGEAPYPSSEERWSGTWYLQAKFHAPKVSGDEQKWLLRQIEVELEAFSDKESKRKWPNVWIVATNVDPSAVAKTGTHDKALALVRKARPKLAKRFHIWGGTKIVELLGKHLQVAKRYGHFLTPGHVLSALAEWFLDDRASVERIVDFLVTEAIEDNRYAKLEQAGSAADSRPGIHRLFVDVPFSSQGRPWETKALAALSTAAAENHRFDASMPRKEPWHSYRRDPRRARVWVIRGGPGQGKSTLGQFFCQIQRAALILDDPGEEWPVVPETLTLAEEIRDSAIQLGTSVWPVTPRIPIYLELKDYAHWLGQRGDDAPLNVLTFVATRIHQRIGTQVPVATLERALTSRSWVVVFDGLDEVPASAKNTVAQEIASFLRRTALRADLLAVCTSRPQGYTGQFDKLGGAAIELAPLSVEDALLCAEPLIRLQRSKVEGDQAVQILEKSVASPAVQSLMKTPLQAHIMAVIVRAGQRPPKMRWRLYDRFYSVIFARERDKGHADPRLSAIFEEDEELLTRLHDHAGFLLHALAETTEGSAAVLGREDFEQLVRRLVEQHKDTDHDAIVTSLMLAAKERLVLLTTPEASGRIRYDVRQLQEFFAARFLFHDVDLDTLRERLQLVAGDSHWREVMHFLMSALVEGRRRNELGVALEVLSWLDQGEGDDATARFCTRLARGGHLAARLLEDGVLEASRSDRQRFRELLRSCLTVDDIEFLAPLQNVDGPASRAWLRTLLEDHISTRQPSESLGASHLLWSLLSEEESVPVSFQEHLGRIPQGVVQWSKEDRPSPWQLEILVRAISCESGPCVLRRPSSKLSRWLREAADDLPGKRGLDLGDLKLIRWWHSSYSGPFEIQEEDLGWVVLEVADWQNEADFELLELASQDSDDSNLIKQLRTALLLECRPGKQSLRSFLQARSQGPWIEFSRGTLAGRIRELDSMELLRSVENQPEGAIEEAVEQGEIVPGIPFSRVISWRASEGSVQEIRELAESFPKYVILRWVKNPESSTKEDSLLKAVVAAIRNAPDEARLVSPLHWHHLLRVDNSIKDLLVEHCSKLSGDVLNSALQFGPDTPPGSFPLDLPHDQGALLALGIHLVALGLRPSSSLAPQYLEDVEKLVSIVRDASAEPNARLGALLIALVHPAGGIDFFADHGSELCDLHPVWSDAIEILASGVDQQGGWKVPKARGTLAKLISAFPIEASGGHRWIDLYRNCREQSRAPVSTAGCREEWLAYGS